MFAFFLINLSLFTLLLLLVIILVYHFTFLEYQLLSFTTLDFHPSLSLLYFLRSPVWQMSCYTFF